MSSKVHHSSWHVSPRIWHLLLVICHVWYACDASVSQNSDLYLVYLCMLDQISDLHDKIAPRHIHTIHKQGYGTEGQDDIGSVYKFVLGKRKSQLLRFWFFLSFLKVTSQLSLEQQASPLRGWKKEVRLRDEHEPERVKNKWQNLVTKLQNISLVAFFLRRKRKGSFRSHSYLPARWFIQEREGFLSLPPLDGWTTKWVRNRIRSEGKDGVLQFLIAKLTLFLTPFLPSPFLFFLLPFSSPHLQAWKP